MVFAEGEVPEDPINEPPAVEDSEIEATAGDATDQDTESPDQTETPADPAENEEPADAESSASEPAGDEPSETEESQPGDTQSSEEPSQENSEDQEAPEENPDDTTNTTQEASPEESQTEEPPESEETAPEEEEGESSEENAEVLLADENGDPLDMASQESADTLANGDPWWMVGSVKYAVVFDSADCPEGTTYGSTCWASTTPIEEALSKIDSEGLIPSDGKLYVEAGDYIDNVVIDGASGNGNLSSLRGLVGTGSGAVTLNGNISISNTTSGFTLSGFTINGSVTLDNNNSNLYLEDLYIQNENGDGLTVTNQSGRVYLTNVQSRDNKGDGARIDNASPSRYSVTVTNSSFDYNDDEIDATWNVGLYINTSGVVTLEGVATSRNNGNGTEIHGFSALYIYNGLFDHNYTDPYSSGTPYGYGLLASTTNSAYVRIENVFAYYNDNTAIDIETAGSVYLDYVRASHSSIRVGSIDSTGETVNERLNEDNKNSGDKWYFSGTNGQELEILLESSMFDTYLELYDAGTDTLLDSNDDIDGSTTNSQINYTLSADGTYYVIVKTLGSDDGDYVLSVNDSEHTNETTFDVPGMKIDTTSGTGSINIRDGMFQDNVGSGLVIDSLKNITLYSVDASYNSQNGAALDTCQYDEILGKCTGAGVITLNSSTSDGWYGANYFLGNSGTGLYLSSGSTIKLINTSAYDNLNHGLEVNNPYSKATIVIQVTLSNFSNVFRNNGGSGIKIDSGGKISIYDTEANSNGENGLDLTSASTISLTIVSASENAGYGLLVNNSSTTGSVNIRNKVNDSQPEFSNNGDDGINITTLGNISIYNIVANENGGSGAVFDTYVSGLGTGSIVLNSYYRLVNTFDDNTEYGLYMTSNGNIVLYYVSASENGDTGLFVDNATTNSSVIMKNLTSEGPGEFSYNGGEGINISTRGHIQLYNLSANSNATSGLVVDNCQLSGEECLGYGKVNIIDLYGNINQFSNNHDYGLYIISGGAVLLRNIEANQNGYNGLYVDNQLELAVQPVTISATRDVTNTFNFNGSLTPGSYPGIEIHTFGNIYFKSIEANNNYAAGAYLYNKDATISASYIKLYDGLFNENQGSGLLAYTKGRVYLYGVSASYNSLTYFDIVLEGETVYERLTSISDYDTWYFEITESTTITDFNIILESLEFDGLLELYDGQGNLLATDDNGFEDFDAQININLTELGTYYIHVLAADGNHGNYTLSINDELHSFGTDFLFYGALIDASAGDEVVVINKGKTINYNDFNDNNYTGIEVLANSSITAYNLSASDNGDTGAYLYNASGSGNITLKMLGRGELSKFDNNTEDGLFAASPGNIYLTNVSASSNGSAGARLNNCLLYEDNCLGSGRVYIRSSRAVNDFSNNQLYGLYIAASGHVMVYDITADGNGLDGLYVKNQYNLIYGNVYIRSSRNNTNSFSGNGWKNPLNTYGLEVYSNGNIYAYTGNVIANYGGGAVLMNHTSDLVRNIYLYDSNYEANQGNGIVAYSKGAIYLYGVQSRYNSVNSGEIDEFFGETIYEHLTPYYESDTWWFSGSENDLVTITLISEEFDVLLELFDKDGNLLYLDDDSFGGTDAQITYNLPADDNYYIRVSANGEEDGNYTLALNDDIYNPAYPTIYMFSGAVLNNTYGSGNVMVTTSSFNREPSFYHNNINGLEISTAGDVNLYSLSAMQNGEDGISIDATAGDGRVRIYNNSRKGTTSYSYNTKFGLYILSSGHVDLINRGRMFLRDNGYTGAFIDNSSGTDAYVFIQDAELNQNGWKGLEIHSSGRVNIRTVLAINNGENGVFVDNTYGTGYVTILGSSGENNISDNGATGLAVYSNGNITVDKVIAIQNGSRGMWLNTYGGDLRLTNSIARLNGKHGVQAYTEGAAYLKKVQSMSNGEGYEGDGLNIEMTDPLQLRIYNSTFIGNEGNGIDLLCDSFGIPLLSSVSYFGNDTDMDGDMNYYIHTI
jgi:hypothetical protein